MGSWGYGLVWTYMDGAGLGTERWTRRWCPPGAGCFRLESARRLRHRSGVTVSVATPLE